MKTKENSMKKSTKTTGLTKVKSLRDLIDSTEWVGIQTRGCSSKISEDALTFQFTHKYGKDLVRDENKSDFVRIRIGKGIMDELDWKQGDRIYISNSPDDQLTFLLCKVDSASGFKLGVETGSTSGRLHFAWRDSYVSVKVSAPHAVEYEIYKNKLIFRAQG